MALPYLADSEWVARIAIPMFGHGTSDEVTWIDIRAVLVSNNTVAATTLPLCSRLCVLLHTAALTLLLMRVYGAASLVAWRWTSAKFETGKLRFTAKMLHRKRDDSPAAYNIYIPVPTHPLEGFIFRHGCWSTFPDLPGPGNTNAQSSRSQQKKPPQISQDGAILIHRAVAPSQPGARVYITGTRAHSPTCEFPPTSHMAGHNAKSARRALPFRGVCSWLAG
eukprot:232484-Chlamydomonas_euryale.AAC.7